MKHWKRVFFGLISVALAASLCVIPVSADVGSVWEFGEDKQDVSEQGVNGWYYLYSARSNMGDAFDVSSLQECEMNNQTSYAAWGGQFWGPAADYPEEFYVNGKVDNVWFLIGSDGKVAPGGTMSAAVKWVAPEAGTFNLKADVTGGNGDPAEDAKNKDGLTYSIYQGKVRLFSRNTGSEAEVSDSIEKSVTLEKGDALYFLCDPNEIPYYDAAVWTIRIEKTAESSAGQTNAATDGAGSPQTGDNTGGVLPWVVAGAAVVVLIGGGLTHLFYRTNKANV